jgi:hypothetical protein
LKPGGFQAPSYGLNWIQRVYRGTLWANSQQPHLELRQSLSQHRPLLGVQPRDDHVLHAVAVQVEFESKL